MFEIYPKDAAINSMLYKYTVNVERIKWINNNRWPFPWNILSKIEKVPRGIRGEKSSKDMVSSRNLVSTTGAQGEVILHAYLPIEEFEKSWTDIH